MFGIAHVPTVCKPFFRPLRRFFHKPQWPYFCLLVLAVSISYGVTTVSALHGFILPTMYPQRLLDFINESPWSPNAVLQCVAMMVLRALGWRAGMPLKILFDATKFRKRGKWMEGAHRFFDTVYGKAGWGHEAVVLCLRFRGVTIPWAIRIYVPAEHVRNVHGPEFDKYFVTTNEIAAALIDELPARFLGWGRCLVLFDSGFLNEVVLKACRRRGVRFISMCQVTRVFYPEHQQGRPGLPRKGGKKVKNKRIIGSYGPGVLRYQGKIIELPSYRGTTKYLVAERIGAMQKVGWVKVVFSRRLRDEKHVALVTNDVNLSAGEVIAGYRERWPIEVFFKTVKQSLGFGDYRLSRLQGVERHLHLSAIAYLLLTHLGHRRPGEATPMREDAAAHSVETSKVQLRTAIAQEHVDEVVNAYGPEPGIQSLIERMKGIAIASRTEAWQENS